MTFPRIYETKSMVLSLSWFDDCLTNFDQLLKMPLPNRNQRHQNDEHKPEGMDLLAWYSPWCNHSIETYGIHLLDVGMVKFADSLIAALTAEKDAPNLSKAAALMWSAHCLHSHELCHGWIEQMIGWAEQGTNSSGNYQIKLQNSSAYIKDEEALCNTAVYGIQHDFLTNVMDACSDEMSESMKAAYDELTITGKNQQEAMLAALVRVMESQPAGYKDFSPIDAHPLKHPVFMAKLHQLLSKDYNCKNAALIKAFLSFGYAMHFAPVPMYFCKTPSWIYHSDQNNKSWMNETIPKPTYKKYGNDYYISGVGHDELCTEVILEKTGQSGQGLTGNLYIDARQMTVLTGIGEKFDTGYIKGDLILICPNQLKGNLLGLLQIKKLKQVILVGCSLQELEKAIDIINKNLKSERDIFACFEELVDNKLKEYAQL